jgi:pyruvate,water dikinase
MSGTPFLRWLDEISDDDRAVVGSKMARLAGLRRYGVEVPGGFAVTVAAFRQFTGGNLESAIDGEIARLRDTDSIADFEEASTRIRSLVESADLDATFEESLREAYEELCFREGQVDIPVAVRSSATGEDASSASFAGQYESYLGVTGADAVVASVRKVWGSLFAARAIDYRLRRNQHHRDTPMGVGVLRLLQARSSGVGFSVHPVSRKTDRIVIEGSWGLGEAFVQGLVEPDHIEVDKSDGRVVDFRVGNKQIVSAYDHTRGTVVERAMPQRFRREPSLNDDMIKALWRTIVDIESRSGHPVDIEWVIERHWRPGQPVSVVQVRPITTLDANAAPPTAPAWNAASYAAKYGLGVKSKV